MHLDTLATKTMQAVSIACAVGAALAAIVIIVGRWLS